MTRLTYIYGLVDPFTQQIRYIGKTVSTPIARLYSHICEARRCDPDRQHYHKNRWILGLLSRGVSPEIVILETVVGDAWQEAEKTWIRKGGETGWDLTNLSDGGEGTPGYPCSEERKKHLSKVLSGRRRSQESIDKVRQRLIGRKPSLEAIKKSAEAKRIYQITPEIISLLGKTTDSDLGRKFNIHPATIRQWRVERGISRYEGKRHYQHIELPDDCLQRLGKIPDEQLANLYGVSPQTIARRRKDKKVSPVVEGGAGRVTNPAVVAITYLMGTMSDANLARLYNVNSKAIYYRRKKLGIPAYKGGSSNSENDCQTSVR